MSNRTLKDIQIEFLIEYYPKQDLCKKSSKEIEDLYNKTVLIKALKAKGCTSNDLSKWSLDKLRKEHKKYLESETVSSKDISDSILFDILS
jgi:hypothetical protein